MKSASISRFYSGRWCRIVIDSIKNSVMSYYYSGNIKLYYEEHGRGSPVVWLHGFSLDRRMWRYQVEYFAARYRMILVDARGHGLSDSPRTGYSREDRVGDLILLAENLRLERFHLVGFSMGAGDALAFAIDHQERLISLTLAGPAVSGWAAPRRYRDFAATALSEGVQAAKGKFMASALSVYEKRNPGLKRELEIMMSGFGGAPWLDPMKGKYSRRDDVGLSETVKVPTLLIVGREDIFFRSVAVRLQHRISGSVLSVIPDSGHMVNMEASDDYNRVLDLFLRENGEAN